MAASKPPIRDVDTPVSPPPLKKRKFESTTTKQAVNNFFTPASKKEPEEITWRVVNETLLLARYQPTVADKANKPPSKRQKIAAFDLDSTLIKTASGNVFGRNATDWRWWHLSVPSTLKQLYADGSVYSSAGHQAPFMRLADSWLTEDDSRYAVVIVTNQGSVRLRNDPKTIKSDQRSLATFKTKVSSILSHFDFPILLLAATARDLYRKPRTRMWSELLEDLDLDEVDVEDLNSSFFVGDAGGRAARGDTKADHACTDRDFAANVGISFHTPEEYFLREEPVPFTRYFEPSTYLNATSTTSTGATPIVMQKKNSLDLVLMCGSPGSGKSTFYWTKLKPLGYERVNQDTLKTRDKCIKVAVSLLSASTSVAVDNTNADPETRSVWVQLAQKHKIPIRCIHFNAPARLCEHNETVRALAGSEFNPEKRATLPHSAFVGFASRFKEPQIQEGFQDIVKIEFEFQGDDKLRRIWSKYWI